MPFDVDLCLPLVILPQPPRTLGKPRGVHDPRDPGDASENRHPPNSLIVTEIDFGKAFPSNRETFPQAREGYLTRP